MSNQDNTTHDLTPQLEPMIEQGARINRYKEAVVCSLFVNISSDPQDEEITAADALAALARMPDDCNGYRAHGLEPQEYFEDWVSLAVWELIDDIARNCELVTHQRQPSAASTKTNQSETGA